MKKTKTPSQSRTIKTEVVCPNDTNPMGILQGGRLVQWMDIAAAVSAQIHAEKICVTASIDKVSFENPAFVGDVITIEAKLTRVFTRSMEIFVSAWSSNILRTKHLLISESYFTFVALDDNGRPTAVPPVKPISKKEIELFTLAGKRRHKLVK
ncbi:MAG: acyl-CoA thioesterase [Cyclobacteriaceae bacterium]